MKKSVIIFEVYPTAPSESVEFDLERLSLSLIRSFNDQGEGLGYDHTCYFVLTDDDIDVKRLLTKAATANNMCNLAALFIDMLSAYAFNRSITQFAEEVYDQTNINGHMREKFHTLQNNPIRLWRELDPARLNRFFRALINFGAAHNPDWARQIAEACSIPESEDARPQTQTEDDNLS